jgi:hypothetical protein
MTKDLRNLISDAQGQEKMSISEEEPFHLYSLFLFFNQLNGPLVLNYGRSSLLTPLIQKSVFSGNTVTDISTNNALPTLSVSLNPVRLTLKTNTTVCEGVTEETSF